MFFVLGFSVIVLPKGGAFATINPVELSSGIAAFEQQHWSEAMRDFLEVLQVNPGNPEAHQYMALVAREMAIARRLQVQQERLQMLDAVTHSTHTLSGSPAVQRALVDAANGGVRSQDEKWHARCEEARMQRQLGHLLPANDLILQVLAENPTHMEAQQELSELQSSLHHDLEWSDNLPILDRYVYQGFYAFGQADYLTAYTAWEKARAVIQQTSGAGQNSKTLQDLRFDPYEKVAAAHLEDARREAELRARFDHAVTLYRAHHFTESLESFRQMAIQEPEYPQLGLYLVQAEAAAEKDRSRRLGEAKRQQMSRLMEKGVAALESEKYNEAESDFKRVLSIDASHTQARSYLAMAQTESSRLHDPKAAQMHYEAGLIAYASGKLDEAVREWRVATRMNPQNEKAVNALNKVQRELAMSGEVP